MYNVFIINPTAQSCATSIPNGKFDHGCSSVPGATCTFSCDAGFTRTVTGPVTCQVGFEWSVPLDSLCTGKFQTRIDI